MSDPVLLSLKERLLLVNQYRILEALYPKEAGRYALHRKAVENGYTGQYDSLVAAIRPEVPTVECNLVSDVFDMYRAIRKGFDRARDRDGVDGKDIEFPGFDGATEGRLVELAQFLVHDVDHAREFQHSFFDSRKPMAERYRRMIATWGNIGRSAALTKQDIQKILAA